MRIVRLDVREDRRLVEQPGGRAPGRRARGRRPPPSRRRRRRPRTQARDPVELRRRGGRAHLRLLGSIGSPSRIAVGARGDPRDELVVRSTRCTSSREPAMQVWPDAAKMPASTPASAASSCGVLEDDVGRLAAELEGRRGEPVGRRARPIATAVSGPPVKAMWSTPGWEVSAAPRAAPVPVTTLTTPGGKPARSNSATSSSIDAEVYSLGLTTTVLPAARAGASFQVASSSGEFHGAIAAIDADGLAHGVVHDGGEVDRR